MLVIPCSLEIPIPISGVNVLTSLNSVPVEGGGLFSPLLAPAGEEEDEEDASGVFADLPPARNLAGVSSLFTAPLAARMLRKQY